MKLLIKSLFLSTALLFVLIIAPKTIKAENKGLQISPLTFKFDIKTAEVKDDNKVFIKNNNPEAINYTLEVENFSKVSDEGAPSFSGLETQEGVTTLADWITFSSQKEGILQPGEEKEVDFSVSVPNGAEPGGHYAAIFVKEVKKTPEGKVEIGISSRVGTLLLVSVPGETKKDARLFDFSFPKFVWKGPINFSMKVENTGSIHYDSKGAISIKPLLGTTATVDMGTHTIIPKNVRNFEGTWNKKFPFGRYTLTASATNGDGQPVTTTGTLWAIPLYLVISAIVAIILITLIVRFVKKHVKIQ